MGLLFRILQGSAGGGTIFPEQLRSFRCSRKGKAFSGGLLIAGKRLLIVFLFPCRLAKPGKRRQIINRCLRVRSVLLRPGGCSFLFRLFKQLSGPAQKRLRPASLLTGKHQNPLSGQRLGQKLLCPLFSIQDADSAFITPFCLVRLHSAFISSARAHQHQRKMLRIFQIQLLHQKQDVF